MVVEEDAPAIVIAEPANTAKLDALPRLIIFGIGVSGVSDEPKARNVRLEPIVKLIIHFAINSSLFFGR
jgi:hypothetical protein